MAKRFDYRQAIELAKVFKKHNVKYLFIGKSGAIILGYPDTTQDVDIFPEKTPENCKKIVSALLELKFPLTKTEQEEILKGKDFVQIRTGPFDIDLVFAPDGIESFNDAISRSVEVEGLPVCSINDIIKSKEAAKRVRDKESLPRLKAFRDWLLKR
ncbi:MAG: hypothetical protein QME68_06465 [Elusimicrobiota bacterium]|nr:hypothetical protein [Elusimicrobiota bacterium]